MTKAAGPVAFLRPAALALLAGLAAALAHPPFEILPGLLGYALMLWLIDGADPRRPLRSAFWRGWLVGVGYFGLGVWWVAEAFFVDAETFGWMAPFAVVFLAGGLALFWGLTGLVYRAVRASGMARVIVFAGIFGLFEWLRGHVLTGFPWNLPGETWKAGSAPSQFAAVAGAYGLTWITVAIAAAPATLLDKTARNRRLIPTAVALVALAGLYGYGASRLPPPSTAEGLRIRIVQPNVDQAAKYDEAFFHEIVGRYAALTAQASAGPRPDVVIWPEGAIPAVYLDELLSPDGWPGQAIEAALAPGQILIGGGPRRRPTGEPLGDEVFNSLFVARRGPEGLSVEAYYDKHHLVPFGEFVPQEDLLGRLGITKLVPMPGSFSAGPPPAPLQVPGAPPFQPLICYESLFPGLVSSSPGPRASWIVNISNDSWFGQTSGPWQLLNLASYRSIEEGLPMVRATPTGVSAVIDAYGRVCCAPKLGLGANGVIDAVLPAPAPPSLYKTYGDAVFWALATFSMLFSLRYFVRAREYWMTRSPNGVIEP